MPPRARQIVAEALAAAPDLTTDFIEKGEFYRDRAVKRLLIEWLVQAGLPHPAAVAKAS